MHSLKEKSNGKLEGTLNLLKIKTHKNLWGSPKEVLRENFIA